MTHAREKHVAYGTYLAKLFLEKELILAVSLQIYLDIEYFIYNPRYLTINIGNILI